MKSKVLIIWITLGTFTSLFSQSRYQKDFEFMWNLLDKEYAYFDIKSTDWKKVKSIYTSKADVIKEDTAFIRLVEQMIYELYDMHMSINRNLNDSFRLIPSYTDAWIQYKNGSYVVADVRPGYEAEKKGIQVGAVIVTINGKKIATEVQKILPTSFTTFNDEVKTFFANLVFAGRHNEGREIRLIYQGVTKVIQLEKPTFGQKRGELIESKHLTGNIGYIKILNNLWNNNLIPAFDSVLNTMDDTKALVLDLRETSDGGNTTVARAIMGRFINKKIPYQRHEYPAEEKTFGVKRSWVEYVFPRKKQYQKPIVVLVGHWTGSVGEALALGFDNIPTAKVVGTKMAGLLGAITCYKFPETGINLCFPFEKLYHSNGTPREKYKPTYKTKSSRETYIKGLELIKK
jgi:carboxyl-terminal processing protease